ncbi:MAG: nicotinate-nucleotide adenylyltransferase [Solirubrobacterales bacterium]
MAERSIGVFGSAFNPPHIAHLIFLAEARWQLGLDEILAVPTGDPYHKDSASDPGPEARLRLARAAFDGIDGIEVSDIEVRRDGPSYTCDTLEVIADRFGTSEIFFLMGADAAQGFAGWKQPERILEKARIGIAPRPGVEREEIQSVFDGLDGKDRIEFIEMPRIDISSTFIRERIEAKEPFCHLVPTKVAQMIKNEDTYGTE